MQDLNVTSNKLPNLIPNKIVKSMDEEDVESEERKNPP